MKRLLFSFLVKMYLKDFSITEKKMTDGEYAVAMTQLANAPQLLKYFNILVGNMIRRHLYIKDMVEGGWYLGGIAAIRKAQTDAERFRQYQERNEPDIEKS